MNTKSLPSLMDSTAKAEGYFVGALKTAYTKHFVQPQSTDLPAVAWIVWTPYAELLKSNYMAIASRYMRSRSWDLPIVCLKHDVYKQKVIEEKVMAVAKLVAVRAGGHRAPLLPDTQLRARGSNAPAPNALQNGFYPLDMQ